MCDRQTDRDRRTETDRQTDRQTDREVIPEFMLFQLQGRLSFVVVIFCCSVRFLKYAQNKKDLALKEMKLYYIFLTNLVGFVCVLSLIHI